MLDVALHPYPTSSERAVAGLQVTIQRTQDGVLKLDYRLEAAMDRIRTEPFAELRRADHLWEHTCFELFVRAPDDAAYCELNFATSGAWGGYRFTGYRAGMQPIMRLNPQVTLQLEENALWLRATVALAELDSSYARAALRLAPCTVIENSAGQHTYWAAHHAAVKPDFHHRDAFTIALDGV